VRYTTFLADQEQEHVIDVLRAHRGLLKHDPSRGLPLKSGGTTDFYINMRDCRNHPKASKEIAEIYASALMRIRPRIDRFVEVPSAVSGLAGVISDITGLPYVTIRDVEKQGRVGAANMIGEMFSGEHVAIIDDVITDGASKVGAYELVRSFGATPLLVVLVDREGGWQKNFAAHAPDMDIWAGMKLHDIRKNLFTGPDLEHEPKVLIALDGMDRSQALELADALSGSGCGFKVNDLALAEGLRIVEDLSVYGRVMLDPKWHDIPNTVKNYCEQVIALPEKFRPWAVTVHASGGSKMLKEAQELQYNGIWVLAVTVLTSFNPKDKDVKILFPRSIPEQVKELAALTERSGVTGLVCSPQEVRAVLKKAPALKRIVAPGTRSKGVGHDDQQRVMTPAEAMDAGAYALVIGRQVIKAPDPKAEVARLLRDELSAYL